VPRRLGGPSLRGAGGYEERSEREGRDGESSHRRAEYPETGESTPAG
jgi:hypothetical protein